MKIVDINHKDKKEQDEFDNMDIGVLNLISVMSDTLKEKDIVNAAFVMIDADGHHVTMTANIDDTVFAVMGLLRSLERDILDSCE